eukprot:Nitzschia sp. Nitz4//scaffold77_size91520//31075//32065//NITZ4_004886-RA/size91520-augustus-gene-0.72-mRNA-1//-1//CDS//3329557979//5610//frame0
MLRPETDDGTALPDGYVPTQFDVICGRDHESFNHDGNREFRRMIQDKAIVYAGMNSKKRKTQVVIDIVATIRNNNPYGGGFIRKDYDTGRWVEIGATKAREKVGHALRIELKKNKRDQSLSTPPLYAGSKKLPPQLKCDTPGASSTGSEYFFDQTTPLTKMNGSMSEQRRAPRALAESGLFDFKASTRRDPSSTGVTTTNHTTTNEDSAWDEQLLLSYNTPTTISWNGGLSITGGSGDGTGGPPVYSLSHQVRQDLHQLRESNSFTDGFISPRMLPLPDKTTVREGVGGGVSPPQHR